MLQLPVCAFQHHTLCCPELMYCNFLHIVTFYGDQDPNAIHGCGNVLSAGRQASFDNIAFFLMHVVRLRGAHLCCSMHRKCCARLTKRVAFGHNSQHYTSPGHVSIRTLAVSSYRGAASPFFYSGILLSLLGKVARLCHWPSPIHSGAEDISCLRDSISLPLCEMCPPFTTQCPASTAFFV